MAHDVFISYSNKDKTIADAVCAKLEEGKIRAWIAPRDVPPGSNFAKSIIGAINTCNIFILIWSANTNNSEHILNEINQAFDHGNTIIPFRIQDIQPTDEMRYYFGRTHWLDAINPPLEKHIATLKDTILVNLGREPQPEKAAPQLQKVPVASDLGKDSNVKKAEVAKPLMKMPHREKRQKKEKKIDWASAAPANWKRAIPFAAGGLVILALAVFFASGALRGASPPDEQRSTSQTAAITPTRTVRPTATATPIPAWVREFSEPILAAINNQEPDLLEDFSQVNNAWESHLNAIEHSGGECPDSDGAGMSITDGTMKASIEPSCRQIILVNPDIQPFTNGVLQIDINFENTRGTASIEYYYRSTTVFMNFDPTVEGVTFGIAEGADSNIVEFVESHKVFDASEITITIISKKPYFLIYVDEVLVFSKDDFEIDFPIENWDLNMWNGSNQLRGTEAFQVDNLKIWDLDKIDL